jgi:hypothetical protein
MCPEWCVVWLHAGSRKSAQPSQRKEAMSFS